MQLLKLIDMTTNLLRHFLSDFEKPLTYYSDNFVSDYNVSEDEKSFNLEIKVPGLTKSDIDIRVLDGVMTITGEKDVSDKEYIRKGYSTYRVKKQFNLTDDIDLNKINASVENGILNVYLYKKDLKSNEIKVKIK